MRAMCQFMDEVDVFEWWLEGIISSVWILWSFVKQRPLVSISLKAKFADEALKPQCVIADLVRIALILSTLELVPFPF